MIPKVKICGIQRKEEVVILNRYLPEYAGFVFCTSKRQVSPIKAKELMDELDPSIKKVGIFLNPSKEEIETVLKVCPLDIVQLHGEETPSFCRQFTQEVWKSFSIENESSLDRINQYEVDGYLLDSFVKGQKGGSGKKFNWNLLENKKIPSLFILAGGLSAENIIEAIKVTSPDVIDISSGVETDGYKDEKKIKELMEKVRK